MMLPHSATDRWLTRATPANSRVFRPGRQPAPCEKPTRRWKLLEAGAFVFVTLCRSPGGRRRASTPRGRALSRRALRSVFEFFSGVGGMRLSFKDAVPAREPFPTWRAFEVDEACCQAYCELYGSKYVTGVRRGELWKNKNQRGTDELWRCSIDRLPDGAFDGGDLWLMSPPCQPFTRTGKPLQAFLRNQFARGIPAEITKPRPASKHRNPIKSEVPFRVARCAFHRAKSWGRAG